MKITQQTRLEKFKNQLTIVLGIKLLVPLISYNSCQFNSFFLFFKSMFDLLIVGTYFCVLNRHFTVKSFILPLYINDSITSLL